MTADAPAASSPAAAGAGSDTGSGQTGPPSPPAVSLPKGGGAVRGIGETFSTNPANGTASLRVPLPVSPGRAGFGPSLALSYDSGSGQGPFSLGWTVGLPAITRKTDRGVPTYDDAAERDVFILSGAEDLVPVTDENGEPVRRPCTVDGKDYVVVRYRPRVEGMYARIERWTTPRTGEVHWRSISRTNVTTVYGRDAASRIADPADQARRVFAWLICESFDDRGNAVVYEYAAEDSRGVDLARACERHRTDQSRSANRYLKAVRYGNQVSRLIQPDPARNDWLFELVFDYGEHAAAAPTPRDAGTWLCRNDAFSSYRSGFEVRTYRLCQRILMFHHFPAEAGVGADCLVRSMTLEYRDDGRAPVDRRRGQPTGSLLASVTLSGHRRVPGGYRSRSLPPLELVYSTAQVGAEVHNLDGDSLENLPTGLGGVGCHWVDLDGESISGVLTEQAGAWFYKPNLGNGRLGPVVSQRTSPSVPLADGRTELLDLAGDGRLDLVAFDGPAAGFFARTADVTWATHRQFRSLPGVDWGDPNLRFVDLTGDGHADLLMTGDGEIRWAQSLAEDGFGELRRVPMPADDDAGPRLVLADGTRSIHLADLSGDGLTDLVRVRNGEVCYWPNLGHGRFGAKVVMDNGPVFDHPDRFDQRRIRLADLDGTGPTDLVYLGADGVDLYLNQAGNGWSPPVRLPVFPPACDMTDVAVVDLHGHGTACLVWSSPLPGDAGRQVRYVDLMGGKPNLLVRVRNNLGAETAVHYESSTRFFLADKAAGRPWATRLPFPVHVVSRVESFDRIGRSRFVSRYEYHHGHFDGVEREFRGFGRVDRYDTEQIAALSGSGTFPVGDNVDPASHVPPAVTRTWFHTGGYTDRSRVSTVFADEYYRTAGSTGWLLDDTVLDPALPAGAQCEACRALKGQLLRQELYALDGSDREPHPYTVLERNYTVAALQPPVGPRPGVFAVHPRETVTAVYERDPADPRIGHQLVLDVDPYGTVLHSVAVAYGRTGPDATLPAGTRAVQATTLVTEVRTSVTNPVDAAEPDAYRAPVPYDTSTFQISGARVDGAVTLLDRAWLAESLDPHAALPAGLTRRLLARQRTVFERDDLAGPLPPGTQHPRGLVHESYRLALTPQVLTGALGNRVDAATLTAAGYVQADGGWWAPSGTVRYAPAGVAAADLLDHTRSHFFLPRRFVDPFGALATPQQATDVEYDAYDLLPVQVVDPLGNTVTAGHRDTTNRRTGLAVDYRVLAPTLVTDPNRNRTAVAVDAFGLVAAIAVMGKPEDDTGDRVDPAAADLSDGAVAALWAGPGVEAAGLLGAATTRLVYDVDGYLHSRDHDEPRPVGMASIARERHVTEAGTAGGSPVQVSFAYSDGTGREIQRKLPAEPDPQTGRARWVRSGWVVLNNKGLPVRRYEPDFTADAAFELAVTVGVSPILCHDPLGRQVATLHPNHTYDKLVVAAWQQRTYDVNDTATRPDPAADPDVGGWLARLPEKDYLPTWYQARIGGDLGPQEQAAARRTALHADTPTRICLDPLGRPVLTVATNRTPPDGNGPPTDTEHRTHVVLDVVGNQLQVADCTDGTPGLTAGTSDRTVARCTYDLDGTRLAEESMEAGTRRHLVDVAGLPVADWDPTDRRLTTGYDALRRPVTLVLRDGADEKTVALTVYGEDAPDADRENLRGQVWKICDGAGELASGYDVKGNRVRSSRRLAETYRKVVDWAGTVAFAGVPLVGRTAFDALNRPAEATHPDGTVVRFGYNAGGLLETISARLPGATSDLSVVSGVEYNARGQRLSIRYGNGVLTTYAYEPDTFRLSRVDTRRGPAFPGDEPVPLDTRRGVQNLGYVYDPVGNVTHIADDAQPRVFNLNTLVEASTDYTYDALYRLVEASGREHLGQHGGTLQPPTPTSATDAPRVDPTDRNALGCYRERYTYDVAGNLTTLVHRGSHPADTGWTRTFTYAEPSQLEPGRHSNRLTSAQVGTDPADTYAYDAAGNMTTLPPLRLVAWNYRDELSASSTQSVTSGVPETTYYVYDGGGGRVRKVTDLAATSAGDAKPRAERVYLGGFELYREFDATGQVSLARTTVHIMDGPQRVAMVETRIEGDDGTDQTLVRYQHANNLGSATVELDADAELISYEEYYPYGCTALAFSRSGTPSKRYRYTAKERDEETGLSYHGARYYAPWLTIWISPDRLGAAGNGRARGPGDRTGPATPSDRDDAGEDRGATGSSRADPLATSPPTFGYCLNNPVRFVDPDGNTAKDARDDPKPSVDSPGIQLVLGAGKSYLTATALPFTGVWGAVASTVSFFQNPKEYLLSVVPFYAFHQNLDRGLTALADERYFEAGDALTSALIDAIAAIWMGKSLGEAIDTYAARGFARLSADQASGLFGRRSSSTRGAVAGAIWKNFTVWTGESVRGTGGRGLHLDPTLLETLGRVPEDIRNPCCFEVQAVNDMIRAGVSPSGAVSAASIVRGSLADPAQGRGVPGCPSCRLVLQELGIRDANAPGGGSVLLWPVTPRLKDETSTNP